MNEAVRERLFGVEHAFDHPVTTVVVASAAGVLILAAATTVALGRAGRLSESTRTELRRRLGSWAVLIPLIVGPILLGAFWAILALTALALLAYREFARATGLFRWTTISAIAAVGIVALNVAALDHWYAFFVAIPPLTIGLIASVAILRDEPRGYLQRVALAVFALLFVGGGLGHFAYLANHESFRPLMLWLLLSVEMNDVFAFVTGRTLGRRKLAPNTSPGKTVAGAVGAAVLTTALAAGVGWWVFEGSPLRHPGHLIVLGLIVSVAGQLGDLMLSSIKRDLGIKDMANLIPGHGGLLDRFDSLLLVAPGVFHYVSWIEDAGFSTTTRIFTGG